MKETEIIPEFSEHLKKLKKVKKQTEKIMDVLAPGLTTAESVLLVAWEHMFDLLYENEEVDMSSMGTYAGILQKLMNSFSQMKTIELKMEDMSMKAEEFEHKKRQWLKALESTKNTQGGISEETLLKIEEELNFL